MTRGEYGLLIDYEYCSGCHACEVACKKEHEMPKGDFGIKILKDGPRQSSDGVWEFDYTCARRASTRASSRPASITAKPASWSTGRSRSSPPRRRRRRRTRWSSSRSKP